MALNPRQLFKPVRKLRKALKKLAKTPAPEEVHELRTQSRRLEAVLHALRFDRTKRGRSLLKSVKPIRKEAGKVRDMDVLTALAATVPKRSKEEAEPPDDTVVSLLELLGHQRYQSARRLQKIVSGCRKRILKDLRRFRSHIEKQIKDFGRPTDPAAVAASLAGELAAWPKMDLNTLHPYRLKVKELRYILELAEEPDAGLIEALGEVKDRIGVWHDWCELEDLARRMSGSSAELVHRIRALAGQELQRAFKTANHLQQEHFASSKNHGPKKPQRIKEPILISAARLSA